MAITQIDWSQYDIAIGDTTAFITNYNNYLDAVEVLAGEINTTASDIDQAKVDAESARDAAEVIVGFNPLTDTVFNAENLGGEPASVAATANSIVKRSAAGLINADGTPGTGEATAVFVEQGGDGLLQKQTPSQFIENHDIATRSKPFIASGTIGDGASVILRPDGKVEEVAGVNAVLGAEYEVKASTYTYQKRLAFDPTTGTLLVIYLDTGGKSWIKAGIVTGTAIAWGAQVAINPGYYQQGLSLIWHPLTGNFFLYTASSSDYYPSYHAITVAGNVVTVGTKTTLHASSATSFGVFAYDSVNDIIMSCRWEIGGNNRFYSQMLSISGTTLTVTDGNRDTKIYSLGNSSDVAVIHDANTDSWVIFATEGLVPKYRTAKGSTGLLTVLPAGAAGAPPGYTNTGAGVAMVYVKGVNLVIMALSDFSNGNDTQWWTGTLDIAAELTLKPAVTYAELPVLDFRLEQRSTIITSNTDNMFHLVTTAADDSLLLYNIYVSADGSFTIGTPIILSAESNDIEVTHNPTTDTLAIFHNPITVGTLADVSVSLYSLSNSNADASNFLGLAAAAAVNGQTAQVTTSAGLNSKQSGLTVNGEYYMQPDGSLAIDPTLTYAGRATSASDIIVKEPI